MSCAVATCTGRPVSTVCCRRCLGFLRRSTIITAWCSTMREKSSRNRQRRLRCGPCGRAALRPPTSAGWSGLADGCRAGRRSIAVRAFVGLVLLSFAVLQGASSCLETVRHLAAALGELGHHLLMQPDVHFRGAVECAGIAELMGELLAGAQAAVEVEQLHQIDDRLLPVVFFFLPGGELRNHAVDLRPRHRLPSSSGEGSCRGGTRGSGTCGGRLRG